MATIHDPKASGAEPKQVRRPSVRRYRWTSKQYYRLGDLGFFDGRRVELINGEIFRMTIDPPHAIAMDLLGDALRATFRGGYRIRLQQPLDFGRRSQPVPDAVVVTGGPRDHAKAHPTTALLVVEVSDSSLRRDRSIKAHLCARAGIAEYWIVNLSDRQLAVHRNPVPDPARLGRFRYADVALIPADGSVSPLAKPGAIISVADLLP